MRNVARSLIATANLWKCFAVTTASGQVLPGCILRMRTAAFPGTHFNWSPGPANVPQLSFTTTPMYFFFVSWLLPQGSPTCLRLCWTFPLRPSLGQAWSNFQQELLALRQSFRFDDFAVISEANPPRSALGRAAYGVGQAVVDGLGALDRALEKGQVLDKLRPRPITIDVNGDGSKLLNECTEIRAKLKQLKLSNKAVWDREHARERAGQAVETPWFIKAVYLSLCVLLDVLFENRPIQRFWFLETVARMPYFSYISMLHLYESFGWWRAGAELRKIHFAEEWNELHHLQIMESLGGDQLWFDRFCGLHAAVVYYWILLGLYFFSPELAYNFSELIEAHAVDTYGEFVDANEEQLKSLPPPLVAAMYYRSQDLYMFDSFQTSQPLRNPRRPTCKNLYDVFCNIRDDEMEHVKTMRACQDATVQQDIVSRREEGPRIGL
ncbi:hypothetical protein Vretifemale_11658 [Volvox reticuliferus]|uniref:Ubiquinol oxidase n=1 Tax=Volvox reticuliferus TaxID=1737510 RepID=A0A8J4FQC5_9CHLO|nr:hypothetical protein Vretifemale_11658 [Volvox reticuliferus]